MSLKRNSFNADGKLSVLRLRTKDAAGKPITPEYAVSEKNTEGKWVEVDTTQYVSGNLVKVEIKEKQWEGETYNTVNLYLKDGKDLYLIDCRINMLNRSLFNAFLSLDTFENLSISTYMQKSKKDGKEYGAISLRQGEELVHWKYSQSELPKPVSVTFKGKTMNDFSQADAFFLEKLKELSVKIGGKKVTSIKTENLSPQATEVVSSNIKEDQEIPF